MKRNNDIGLIGMAVMGQNLALNLEAKGYSVSVYNRTSSRTEEFVESLEEVREINPTYSIEELVASLARPRKVMMMVKAGDPVDAVIDDLLPHLDPGDVVIDGGNSHFPDTDRRLSDLEDKGINYLGTGVSGGEYGALHGPSIMPGGHRKAYDEVGGLLEDAAAETELGPCCTYLGPGSAGHYVKMVHNGIEYGVMEAIAEAYWFMRELLEMGPEEMAGAFADWNEGLNSYLMEITVDILCKDDEETGKPLIDMILDKAKQKGTGKWSVQSSLDLGIPIPTITAGVQGRILSAHKREREKLADRIDWKLSRPKAFDLELLGRSLDLVTISAYAQGMKLLSEASEEFDYGLELDEVARIWMDGCIIRSHLLKEIRRAYSEEAAQDNLFLDESFEGDLKKEIRPLRKTVREAKKWGLPFVAFNSTLDYLDSMVSEKLPANMIQAQRDYFGAHTYERVDRNGRFHTDWLDG